MLRNTTTCTMLQHHISSLCVKLMCVCVHYRINLVKFVSVHIHKMLWSVVACKLFTIILVKCSQLTYIVAMLCMSISVLQ